MEPGRGLAVEGAPALEAQRPQLVADHDAAHDHVGRVAEPADRDRFHRSGAGPAARLRPRRTARGSTRSRSCRPRPARRPAPRCRRSSEIMYSSSVVKSSMSVEGQIRGGEFAAVGPAGLLALDLVVDPSHFGDRSVGDPQHDCAGPLVPHRDRDDRQLLGRPPQEGPGGPSRRRSSRRERSTPPPPGEQSGR